MHNLKCKPNGIDIEKFPVVFLFLDVMLFKNSEHNVIGLSTLKGNLLTVSAPHALGSPTFLAVYALLDN